MSVDVTHRPELSRFEVAAEGDLAVLTYERRDGSVELQHTVVPVALEGRGIGTELARTAVGWARAERLEVVPVCSFVQAWLAREQDRTA
jgi:uncharacterized protein